MLDASNLADCGYRGAVHRGAERWAAVWVDKGKLRPRPALANEGPDNKGRVQEAAGDNPGYPRK